MRRQRKVKEQDKTPEKKLNKMEANNLPDTEFKALVIKTLKELRGRIDDLSEYFNKGIENVRKNQSEIKNTNTEMNNTLNGINSRLDEGEDQVSDTEDKIAENTQSK